MRWIAGALIALLVPVFAGCAQNPFSSKNDAAAAAAQTQQQAAISPQVAKDLQTRAATLDHDNQELESLLAQNRQQSRLLEDQLAALREQLTSTTTQLSQTRQEKDVVSQKAQAMVASTQLKSGASITANNSLHTKLQSLSIPGAEVREDGDVIRIELASDKLFDVGTNRLRAGASVIIDGVAAEIVRAFPDQIIGVEGYTNTAPVAAGQVTANHQLSLQQATAVFDQLVSRGRLRPDQLFIVGQGANHPIVSNATPAGQARNRRIDLVVYPEKRD